MSLSLTYFLPPYNYVSDALELSFYLANIIYLNDLKLT